MHPRLARHFALALGIVYAVMGSLEVILRLKDPDFGAMAFLGGTLLVGAALILGGVLSPVAEKYRLPMIIGGATAGLIATVWTVVIPILAIAVVVLNLNAHRDGDGAVSTRD